MTVAAEVSPSFHLVLPRDKRERLTALLARQSHWRACPAAGCTRQGMPVVLIESETQALLCPDHQLVLLDGSPVEGQPMLVTAGW